jgi:hypothetical protein
MTPDVIARSEATKQSSAREARKLKSAVVAASSAFFARLPARGLDCFAIGEAKRRRSSNGYGSQ